MVLLHTRGRVSVVLVLGIVHVLERIGSSTRAFACNVVINIVYKYLTSLN